MPTGRTGPRLMTEETLTMMRRGTIVTRKGNQFYHNKEQTDFLSSVLKEEDVSYLSQWSITGIIE
jgi:uncharacterized protein (UPF0216 family)